MTTAPPSSGVCSPPVTTWEGLRSVGDQRTNGRLHKFGSSRGRFASYNGTAPIEISSGDRVIFRLSRRGNRQLNHAIHMTAVTQISRPGSEGRAYCQRKIAEGMGRKAALRALKRRISDTLLQRMIDDTRRHDTRSGKDPGGQPGNDAVSSGAGSHPDRPALRTSHSPAKSRSDSALEIPFHFYGLTAPLFDKTRQLLGIERRLIDRRTPARADRRMPTAADPCRLCDALSPSPVS